MSRKQGCNHSHFSIRHENLARKCEQAWDQSFQSAGMRVGRHKTVDHVIQTNTCTVKPLESGDPHNHKKSSYKRGVCLWEVKNAVFLNVSSYRGCPPKGGVHQQGLDDIELEPYLRWLYAFENQKYLNVLKIKYSRLPFTNIQSNFVTVACLLNGLLKEISKNM